MSIWPWIISGCWLTILLAAALVMRRRERREWARDAVFQQHRIEWNQRAEVAHCVALDTCPYPPPFGCGDACGAERPRAEVTAVARAVKGRHRA
jgi:hypothetical protein